MLKNMNWILGINSMNDLREVIEKNENIESGKYYYLNYDGKELIIRGINNDLEGLQLIEYIIEKNGTLINFEKKIREQELLCWKYVFNRNFIF